MKTIHFLRGVLSLFLIICGFMANAQNLVPNPSFEKVKKIPPGWISNHMLFEKFMDDWTTPNLGSPDILFNKVLPIIRPPRRGVDLSPHKARTGQLMVGFKTYGCQTNTQHCKEYIQVKLKQPIQKGEQYFIEFWVNAMSTSPYTNNIGLAFSDVEIQDDSEYGLHYFDPVVNATEVLGNSPNNWHRISATVTADRFYEYIVIGNFFTDEETEFVRREGAIYYSYYLIDDVLVRPLHGTEDFTNSDLEVGNTISLKNIHFKKAEADLLPASFAELDKLVSLLKDNADISIQVNGHTDNQGSAAYNLELSEKRALAVVDYLSEQGIEKERLKHQGFGESRPIESNDKAAGQQLNRRVEFVVLKN